MAECSPAVAAPPFIVISSCQSSVWFWLTGHTPLLFKGLNWSFRDVKQASQETESCRQNLVVDKLGFLFHPCMISSCFADSDAIYYCVHHIRAEKSTWLLLTLSSSMKHGLSELNRAGMWIWNVFLLNPSLAFLKHWAAVQTLLKNVGALLYFLHRRRGERSRYTEAALCIHDSMLRFYFGASGGDTPTSELWRE